MGQTIGFPANAAKLDRSTRTATRKRLDRQLLSHAKIKEVNPAPSVEVDVDVYLDLPEEWFGLTTPTTKYDYDVYLTTESFKAAVYPHNREYRYVERVMPDGKTETIYPVRTSSTAAL